MALSDDELLDFEIGGLNVNLSHIRHALINHGNVYRSHLVAARYFEGWRDQVHARSAGHYSAEYLAGLDDALATVIACLRQGDLIPGGALYEEEVSGRTRF